MKSRPDPFPNEEPRSVLARLARANGDDYAALSRLIGRNPAYVQQYIARGSPRVLAEADRRLLARYYGIDERLLGAPEPATTLRRLPALDVGASAGPGGVGEDRAAPAHLSFEERWLRELADDPARLHFLRVAGDSMVPTLHDGDDIMVETLVAGAPLRDGIHILRLEGAIHVKRLAPLPRGRLRVISDNSAYPAFEVTRGRDCDVLARVRWIGRKL